MKGATHNEMSGYPAGLSLLARFAQALGLGVALQGVAAIRGLGSPPKPLAVMLAGMMLLAAFANDAEANKWARGFADGETKGMACTHAERDALDKAKRSCNHPYYADPIATGKCDCSKNANDDKADVRLWFCQVEVSFLCRR